MKCRSPPAARTIKRPFDADRKRHVSLLVAAAARPRGPRTARAPSASGRGPPPRVEIHGPPTSGIDSRRSGRCSKAAPGRRDHARSVQPGGRRPGQHQRRSDPAVVAGRGRTSVALENVFQYQGRLRQPNRAAVRLDAILDVWEIINAAATKPFGFMKFTPGPGVGGHCIPVDPYYLSWRAREFDFIDRFVEAAADINFSMPRHVVNLVAQALNDRVLALKDAKVGVLGVAFKPNVQDARNSPAAAILAGHAARGADVRFHDPLIPSFRDATGLVREWSLNRARRDARVGRCPCPTRCTPKCASYSVARCQTPSTARGRCPCPSPGREKRPPEDARLGRLGEPCRHRVVDRQHDVPGRTPKQVSTPWPDHPA